MDRRTPTIIAGITCSLVALGIVVGSRQKRSADLTVASSALPRGSAVARRVETYRGYRIDASAVQNQPNLPAVLASVRAQLDIVEAVPWNPQVRELFRAVPLMLVPGTAPNAHYVGRFGIQIEAVEQRRDQPTLLREYLHAYHTQVLPQGEDNPDVLGFHRRALDGARYPRGTEVRDFFAFTAMAYLRGRIAQPSLTRAELCQTQPDYCAYLQGLFGEPASATP